MIFKKLNQLFLSFMFYRLQKIEEKEISSKEILYNNENENNNGNNFNLISLNKGNKKTINLFKYSITENINKGKEKYLKDRFSIPKELTFKTISENNDYINNM